MFDESIKFKYSWRPYQAKVLEKADRFLKDGRINIVAAPGSGKTVLGLELARRLNNPVLILSPTVTIKNQWIDRFVTLFMPEGSKTPEWISDNIYSLNKFTSVTYQGLHYAYKRTKMTNRRDPEETDDEVEFEKQETTIDIKTYDIVKEIKDNKIKTIVLDEAHHLKTEWWQSLTNILSELKDVKIVSLTATPPYDTDYTEWQRYIKLCGDIDMEISVPELVQAKNLCPHQDFVYFSYPTKEERDKIQEHKDNINKVIEEIKLNKAFAQMLLEHPYIDVTARYLSDILDNAEFYSSMLVFLNAVNAPIKKEKVEILGHNKPIPPLDLKWMERLLQYILFEEMPYFMQDKCIEVVKEIEGKLNKIGVIEKKKVILTNSESIKKYFTTSVSKLDSINEIVKGEYANLGHNLRMVILTDFLRKEYIFEDKVEQKKIGVFSILLNLIEQNPSMSMAVLTGSIFMIPRVKIDLLVKDLETREISKEDVSFVDVPKTPDYVIVKPAGKYRSVTMKSISKLFADGEINIIIGTKSLLGEGWDEPSINSLILASFVGSFVLSNQMRGRAIRTNDNPRKTANIWHLVSVLDAPILTMEGIDGTDNPDYKMLQRRFDSFVGIGQTLNVIESGIDRLDILPKRFSKPDIDRHNKEAIRISNDRERMYDRWFEMGDRFGGSNMRMVTKVTTKRKFMSRKFTSIDYVAMAKMLAVFLVLMMGAVAVDFFFNTEKLVYNLTGLKLTEVFIRYTVVTLLTAILEFRTIRGIFRALYMHMPRNQLKIAATVVVNSMCEANILKTPRSKIVIKSEEDDEEETITLTIKGVTLQENNEIIKAVTEIFDDVRNQKYIIECKNSVFQVYYSAPEILSVNKTLCSNFFKHWKMYIGNSKLISTRSEAGRKKLLEARKQTFNYESTSKFKTKKKPVSDWQ